MNRRLLYLLSLVLAITVALVAADQQQTVTAGLSDLPRMVGSVVTLEDVVTHINEEKQSGFVYLNFSPFPQQALSIAIHERYRASIPPAVLRGGRMKVTGRVSLDHMGKPQIVYGPETILTPVTTAATAASVPAPALPAASMLSSAAAPKPCCRTCSSGKACGNSCIASRLVCHQPPGCAC